MPRSKKPPVRSAGILLYRREGQESCVLLGHPGGPFYGRKDDGVWTIPKGLIEGDEDAEVAARREFQEELGFAAVGELESLGEITIRSGKVVTCFGMEFRGAEADLLARFDPGEFTMEWPPKSGRTAAFPEVDRIEFFDIETARVKITAGQLELLDWLEAKLG